MAKRFMAQSMLLFLICMVVTVPAFAEPIFFSVTPALTADRESLAGQILVTLHGDRTLYHPRLTGYGPQVSWALGQWSHWEPGTSRKLALSLPARHLFPGEYHLLLELLFQDVQGDWQGMSTGVAYQVGESGVPSTVYPSLHLLGHGITWDLGGLSPDLATATLTTGPFRLANSKLLTPSVHKIHLEADPARPPPPHGRMEVSARLEWIWNGQHYSQIFPWTIETDGQRQWRQQPWLQEVLWWRDGLFWQSVAALLVVLAVVAGGVRRPSGDFSSGSGVGLALGELLLSLAITAWLAAHLPLELLGQGSWPVGMAEEGHHARFVTQWLSQGGAPEQVVGYGSWWPVTSLPGFFVAALSPWLGEAVALKWVLAGVVLLVPPATHAMGVALGWPVVGRLLASAAATASLVVLNETVPEHPIYSQVWGLIWLIGLMASLGRWVQGDFLHRPVAAVVFAAALLMSHFPTWIVAILASLLLAAARTPTLRLMLAVVKIYGMGALLVSVWWLPMVTNGLPALFAEGSVGPLSWQTLFPKALWPFGVMWFFWRNQGNYMVPTTVAWAAVLGYLLAPELGLDDARFLLPLHWGGAVTGGVLLGQRLVLHSRRPLLWTLALLAWLPAWWMGEVAQRENQVRGQLTAMENKALWPEWQSMAQSLHRSPEAGRILLEEGESGFSDASHALALAGATPLLTGMGWQGDLTAPFVHQLLADVAQTPATVHRFPALRGTLDRLVAQLAEMHVDTLIVHSVPVKKRLLQDHRFVKKGEFGPFLVLALQEPATALVSVVGEPITFERHQDWLGLAHRRFLLDLPYTQRKAFLTSEQSLPFAPSSCAGGEVQVSRLDGEGLVFQTNRPGCPHVVRLAYHPSWKSVNGEAIFAVEPAFLLIHPVESSVTLVFEGGWSGWVGLVLGGLGGWLLWLWPSVGARVYGAAGESRDLFPWPMVVLTFMLCGIFYYANPERTFLRALKSMDAGQLDEIWFKRDGDGRRGEALLWAARALEKEHKIQDAEKRYQMVADHFPATPQAPEALYRLAGMRQKLGDGDGWKRAVQILQTRYPGNAWSLLIAGEAER